jgi:hypothetical protein
MNDLPIGTQISEATRGNDEIDWPKIRREISKIVTFEATDIINALVEKAKTGHLQSVKFLFALAGFFPQVAEENGTNDFSLARMLCDRLGLSSAPEAIEGELVNPEKKLAVRGNGHALK